MDATDSQAVNGPITKYQHLGQFDRFEFTASFMAAFGKSGRFNANAMIPMIDLLGMIERDRTITDIRWAAYMLATVMWETTSPVTTLVQAHNKKGKPLVGKDGKPVLLKRRRWLMTMSPVAEVGFGKGRNYHEPVKVKLTLTGDAEITEQDGDRFSVSPTGAITNLTKKAKMGTVDGGPASKAYEEAEGDEHAYFGRGYVQLTWWSNYAKAGAAVGKGLSLLTNPDLVKEPQTAYTIMSHGMVTGFGFANGRKFSDYFTHTKTDYIHARRMVNGSDHAADIAAIAQKFEAILLKARVAP